MAARYRGPVGVGSNYLVGELMRKLIIVLVLLVGAPALADEARPPNLCTTEVRETEVMEWDGGTVGIEWRAYDADGDLIGYGNAPDMLKGARRAVRVTKRNEGCAQFLPPDLELPYAQS